MLEVEHMTSLNLDRAVERYELIQVSGLPSATQVTVDHLIT